MKPNTRLFNSKRRIKGWKSREQGSTLLEVCFKYMKMFLWVEPGVRRKADKSIRKLSESGVGMNIFLQNLPEERLKIHHKIFMLD